MNAPLGRSVTAEATGTGLLATVVVGSGIQATELSHGVGVQPLADSLAAVFGLGVLILLLKGRLPECSVGKSPADGAGGPAVFLGRPALSVAADRLER
ncbi:hypothetical protein [Streptomyces sp. NPDC001604]|uniref:hypothetical protein n=1 Tax=Streptomyces sp. NPDC001604 TaxID=3364593 RepID=UPI0036AF1A9D